MYSIRNHWARLYYAIEAKLGIKLYAREHIMLFITNKQPLLKYQFKPGFSQLSYSKIDSVKT